MAHKKAAGSTRLGRDSESKRLGVKIFGGAKAIAGNIIIRQHGTKYHAGENTFMGMDHTIHAATDGVVKFQEKKVVAFTGNKAKRMFVHIDKSEKLKA